MKKRKVSQVKKSNKQNTKLKKQGKSKLRRHKKKGLALSKTHRKPTPQHETYDENDSEAEQEEPRDVGKEMATMVDGEDLEFLTKAVVSGSYSMFNHPGFKRDKKVFKRKLDEIEEGVGVEKEYEDSLKLPDPNKKTRYLLPIKTKHGLTKRSVVEDVKEEEDDESDSDKENNQDEEDDEEGENDQAPQDDDFDDDEGSDMENIDGDRDVSKPMTTAEMMAWRETLISQYKFKIGILCSALLENPEAKVLNIGKLLKVYNIWRPELQITLKKLVLASLLEVFKDILPAYQIKHQEDPQVKLKKETRDLQNFEKSLLKGYRGYLEKLEKVAARLYQKKGDTRVLSQHDITMGVLGVKCLSELLVTHPYFNYGKNIVRLLVPYLNCAYPEARTLAHDAVKRLFVTDTRGEMTLEIVRKINDLVKTRKHAVRAEVVSVLCHLKIHEVNLDEMKEAEIKEKKLLQKKSRVINLSKKEKKRQKRIAEVEKELLETKAEENKQTRNTLLTETTKVVFTIYFRILKNSPSGDLLSAALQGLAKFGHVINIEFYQDLVRILNQLMDEGDLKTKEQLNCILTVFRILEGHGAALNIDPNKFYVHLYVNMFNVAIGKRSKNEELLIDCLETVVLGRRKKLTQSRLLSFTKRIATIALHQEHHVALACLVLIKQILQLNRTADALLESDTSVGQGVFLSELQDPEYCNAASTCLFEMCLLRQHYHPTVRLFADNILNGVPPTGPYGIPPEIGKLSSLEILKEYDTSELVFKPSVPTPAFSTISKIKSPEIRNVELRRLCDDVLKKEFSCKFPEKVCKKPREKLFKQQVQERIQ